MNKKKKIKKNKKEEEEEEKKKNCVKWRPFTTLRIDWNRLIYVRNIGAAPEWHKWILTEIKAMQWVGWIYKSALFKNFSHFYFLTFLLSCAFSLWYMKMATRCLFFVLLKCMKLPSPPQQNNRYILSLEGYNCIFVGSWINHMYSDITLVEQ